MSEFYLMMIFIEQAKIIWW